MNLPKSFLKAEAKEPQHKNLKKTAAYKKLMGKKKVKK